MNPQERQLVDELFERLSKLEGVARDAEAVTAINQGLLRAPNAIYALVQTTLLQDEALKRAAARIEELEGNAGAQPTQSSFLDSMRGAILGQQQRSGSVPSVPASSNRPAWNTGAVYQGDQRNQPLPQGGDPRPQQGGGFGGGSFLGTAAAAAVGVIGGSMLASSIGGLMGGGNKQGFGDASSMGKGGDGGSPWSSDPSKRDLASEAGLNDIGRSGARDQDAAGSRQGFFDQASNDDDGDYDSDDDFDSGDSDTA